jgi:AcrR family transcriptional regulator
MRPSGRRPGRAGTRGKILRAARRLFGERGYDGATIRAIAAEAGVNPALVHHYFRTKEQVFVAALDFPVAPDDMLAAIEGGPRAEVGRRAAAFILSVWRDRASRDPLLALLRSSMTRERTAALLREYFAGAVLTRVSATLGADPVRVTAAVGQAVGVMLMRYVIRLEPLASAPDDEVIDMLAPMIQRSLT